MFGVALGTWERARLLLCVWFTYEQMMEWNGRFGPMQLYTCLDLWLILEKLARGWERFSIERMLYSARIS